MNRATVAIGAVVIAAVLGWVAYNYTGGGRAAPSASTNPPPVPVTPGAAETRDMPIYVRGIGSVQAFNTVTVKSRVVGQIVKVDFTEGQEVKAGDPLFEIDPRPFQAALAQAMAAKEKDQAQLTSAQADLQRYAQLVGPGYQTRQTFDQQKGLVGQLQASLKADEAAIDNATLNLTYATIRSPIDGRTGARLVDIGNLVHATDNTGLVSITQLKPIFVTFTVPQNQLDRTRKANAAGPVEVQALSADDQTQLATGKLTLIDNQIDPATGTIRLKGTFDNTDETLWPGEFVNTRLVVGVDKNAATVPARALQRGPNGEYLFVIKPDMTVEIRNVEVAEVEQGVAAIGKGLAAGEQVVVDGQYRLDQGSKVNPQTPTADASH
ncbi:MAG TPA: efflux RND transporter periplasmic adaptor subunit [Stellaceae bacterium]|nr:efflux RND transporter periplasmic adaptor subunit [Stellaceae bacterium]